MLSIKKKSVILIMLGIFIFVSSATILLKPQPAHAVGGPSFQTGSIPQELKKILDKVYEGLKIAVINAVVNFLEYFTQKIAYDSAVYLASGGQGQKPLIFTEDAGEYLTDTLNEAGGKAIEAFSDATGLNLCEIPDVNLDLSLKVGLRSQYGPPTKPDCTVTNMINNWGDKEAWKSKYAGLKDKFDPAKVFVSALSVEQSDLGITMSAKAGIDRIQAEAVEAAKLERAEGQGAKAVKDIISGKIKTPSQVIAKQIKDSSPSEKNKDASVNFGAVLGAGAWQVIPSTLSVFFNTLVSDGLKNIIALGMFPTDEGAESAGAYNYTDASSGGRRRAEQIFSSILIPDIKPVDQYDILSQMASCPETPGIYNCVIDSAFSNAVQQARLAKPVTIKEALAKNYLHGSWKLIPPSDPSLNASKMCSVKAYCHANIKKLRQTNILSLGFEIAAQNSNPDKPWTLKQVVDGFNDCNYAADGITVIPDPKNKPFCHLIDPDWVLIIPETRCNALGYTNNLVDSAASDRQQECVDLSTCVAYDTKGTCISYGYCTRSKNVWRIDGDKCDAQNSTCISYKNASGKIVSYLYSTLDTQNCDANNVGCNLYSVSSTPTASSSQNWVGFEKNDLKNLENDIVSPVVFFNKNANSKCNSAGCNEYLPANSIYGTSPFYLKKAPDYLGCYDSDPNKIGIQWPKSTSDLGKIKGHADCDNYAQVCIPEEENCSLYTQANTNDIIPGKFKPGAYITQNGKSVYQWNDQCHSSCVGYDAYREMPASYSTGQSLAYIIPSTNAACTSQESGCSGFTNLSTTTEGIEKVEYYTYLRPCIKPNPALQKTFYTYEGGTFSGFQLKVYVLEIDPTDPDKGPKYYRTTGEKKVHDASCSEALYKAKTPALSKDCRQFTDSDGKVFYVKLDDTIVVDQSCVPYRLNKTETFIDNTVTNQNDCTALQGRWTGGSCSMCFNDGIYKDGLCYYNGLPGTTTNNAGNSLTCTAASDSCRPYKGNSANNIEKVVLNSGSNYTTDDFENDSLKIDMENWDCADQTKQSLGGCKLGLSNESTRSGEHSLGLSITQSIPLLAIQKLIPVTPGNSYSISFWMKSDATRKVEVSFVDSKVDIGTIAVSDAWQYYKLGPIDIPKTYTTTTDKIGFGIANSNGAMYIDNLQVTKINNQIYLVKKKISIPDVCDANQNDNLPGQALGCTQYTAGTSAVNNNTYYLTGFSYLCREEAIGCVPLLDTYNTDNKTAELYNVWLNGLSGKKAVATIDGVEYSCQVKSGDKGCYVANIPGYSPKNIIQKASNIKITTSTVYIPADTPSSSPLYLVVNKKSSCNSSEKGCSYVGKQTMTINGPKYESVLLLNDPAQYSKNLCQEEGMGCGTYSSSEGNLYFKDPAITGQKICKYQKSITLNGANYRGWFWKDVGVCGTSTITGIKTAGPKPVTYCSSDTDCSADKKGYTTCINKDTLPCYPNYIQNQNEYGLWPFGNKTQYQGFVGECPASQSGCTEYRDPNDNNKGYYLINNTKIKTAKQDCTGGVSNKAGCVLFDQTDIPGKTYSSELTYAASKAKDYQAVQPISSSTVIGNDSNVVMKVIRDRECGEWLYCKSSENVWDAANSKWNQRCDIIGRCNSASAISADSDGQNCTNPLDSHALSNKILTEDYYKRRKIDWNSMDYIGYSILDMFPVEELRQVDLGTSSTPDYRLVKYIITGNDCVTSTIKNGITGYCTDGTNEGKCIKPGICVISPKGGVTTKSITKDSPPKDCRSYPDKNSPFPYTKAAAQSSIFQNANFCNEKYVTPDGSDLTADGVLDCECQFTKQEYGDGVITKFWKYDPFKSTNLINNQDGFKKAIDNNTKTTNDLGHTVYGKYTDKSTKVTDSPKGLCYNTSNFEGWVCDNDDDCRDYSTSDRTGTCMRRKKEESYVGWKGYCLEEDKSRSLYGEENSFQCLSWFPIDNISGSFDMSSNPKAGYIPPSTGGEYYCAEGRGNNNLDDTYVDKGYTYKTGAYTKLLDVQEVCVAVCPGSYIYGGVKKTYNKQLHINDVDYIVLSISGIDTQSTYQPPFFPYRDDGYVIKDGYYLIRNGSKGDVNKDVVTMYGDAYGKCGVYEADVLKNKAKKGSIASKCLTDKNDLKFNPDSIETFEPLIAVPWLPSTVSVDKKEKKESIVDYKGWYNQDFASGITSKYKDSSGNTILRGMFEDGDDGGGRVKYVDEDRGFFANIGDSTGGDAKGLCDNGNDNDQNAFEYYLKFDTDGFLIESSWMGCTSGEQAGSIEKFKMDLRVYAVLREYCTKIVDVADGGLNVAYTNNIWEYSNYQVTGNNAKYSLTYKPFGSLGYLSSSEIDGKKYDVGLLYGPRQTDVNGGMLYGCADSRKCGGSYNNQSGKIDYDINNALYLPTLYSKGYILSTSLFAKSNKVFSLFNSSQLTNAFKKDTAISFNRTESSSNLSKAPRVRSVLTDFCVSGSKEKCLEGKDDTITINGQSGGDVLLKKSPGVATLQFYMLADKDQMPITRIKVDWDDGYPEKVKLGMFGNYRGIIDGKCDTTKKTCFVPSDDMIYDSKTKKYVYSTTDYDTKQSCESNKDCEEMTICSPTESSAPTFSRTSNACNSNYMKFVNTYTCNINSNNFTKLCTEKDSIQSKYPNGCCIFYPRVQIKDNWGWYNSSEFGCKGKYKRSTSPGGDGCYDAGQLDNINIYDLDEGREDKIGPWTSTSTIRVILPPK